MVLCTFKSAEWLTERDFAGTVLALHTVDKLVRLVTQGYRKLSN